LPPDFVKSPGKEYKYNKCDTRRFDIMPPSLRIPQEKEKSAFVLEAADGKLGLVKDRGRRSGNLQAGFQLRRQRN
jgi:hypothetical protein